MEIETYIQAIKASPAAPTATTLTLAATPATTTKPGSYATRGIVIPDNGTLLERLRAVQQRAEADVLEYGCNLHWNDGTIRLGKLVQGDKTTTPIKSKALTRTTYLGDFHVHPYREKGSPEASIGPSTPDITDWIDDWHKEGAHHRDGHVGLFLVFAGKALCITIFRQCTRSFAEFKALNHPRIEMDFAVASQQAEKLLPGFSRHLSDCQAGEGDHMTLVKRERDLWNQVPTHAHLFSAANLQMNQEYANAFSYEYFIADTTGRQVIASLVSNRVYEARRD
jgi:hypothetical protein